MLSPNDKVGEQGCRLLRSQGKDRERRGRMLLKGTGNGQLEGKK